MNDPTQDQQAAIRQRMAQLRAQFIKRTQGELASMSGLLERVRQGDVAALRDMELLAHKINGTGATFGFVGISTHAGDIERMVAAEKCASDAERADCVAASLQRLQGELKLLAED